VFGQVSENHGALREFIIEGGSVLLSCLTALDGAVILLNGNKTPGKSRSPRSIMHPWCHSYSDHDVSLLIFCQAEIAMRKTSTIAAPNIEILMNN
jgi:hypothetical protein